MYLDTKPSEIKPCYCLGLKTELDQKKGSQACKLCGFREGCSKIANKNEKVMI